jgi:hypothetical protein
MRKGVGASTNHELWADGREAGRQAGRKEGMHAGTTHTAAAQGNHPFPSNIHYRPDTRAARSRAGSRLRRGWRRKSAGDLAGP